MDPKMSPEDYTKNWIESHLAPTDEELKESYVQALVRFSNDMVLQRMEINQLQKDMAEIKNTTITSKFSKLGSILIKTGELIQFICGKEGSKNKNK